ncbi:hypothetical protein [Actinomadura welshii]|uniref:hypothetical protein n=1 Tax=Actinomadura welshii TaxID=3103817 RepID=UPI0003AD2C36|nr:hypothetical protein [Actinomadura madurae]
MSKILIGKYEGTIYPEKGGYTGALALGFGPDGKRRRLKRRARTKGQVLDKLKEAVQDLEKGIKTPANDTVADCVEDWLAKGLKGLDDDTVGNCRSLARKHVIPLIGRPKIGDLRADEVDEWL